MVNLFVGLLRSGAPLMPEIVADPLSPSCCRLFRRSGIEEYQPLGPDLLLPRARRVRTFREGKLRQPAGAAARHPQSQAAGARPCCPADDRAGAVGSDRPQASSVAAARRATLAAASRFDRPGGASGDRSVVVARGRGFFAGADQRSDRDRAARSRPPRARISQVGWMPGDAWARAPHGLVRRLMRRPAIQTSSVRAGPIP